MADDPVVHVVEDDTAMRDALLTLLGGAGLPAQGYATAEDFLARRGDADPACLVADLRLPGIDGLALHKRLVSAGVDPATVIITGDGDIPMAVAALKAGALDFVTKPFNPAILLDSVREALRHAAERDRRKAASSAMQQRREALTPREKAILSHLAEGHPSKIIAANSWDQRSHRGAPPRPYHGKDGCADAVEVDQGRAGDAGLRRGIMLILAGSPRRRLEFR